MSPQFDRFEGVSIFDDKGEVKRLVARVVQERNAEVTIDRMRQMDFSYVFILFKMGKSKEVELTRSEIEASWDWKNGNIDKTLQKKIENTLSEL